MILPDLGRLQNPIDAGKRGAHTLFKDMVVHESHALLNRQRCDHRTGLAIQNSTHETFSFLTLNKLMDKGRTCLARLRDGHGLANGCTGAIKSTKSDRQLRSFPAIVLHPLLHQETARYRSTAPA